MTITKSEKRQARILALQVFFYFEQKKFIGDIKDIFDEVLLFDNIDESDEDDEKSYEKLVVGESIINKIEKTNTDSPLELNREVKNYAFEIVKFAAENLASIDNKIKERTKDWGAFDRINPVERNLLRTSIAEMNDKFDVPPTVVITEAIEIAKVFGTDESTKFINAVLDNIKNELEKKSE